VTAPESVGDGFATLLLGVLGHRDDEFTSLLYDDGAGPHTAVMTPADAVTAINKLPDSANIYFGVNTVKGPARNHAGRGTEADITRVAALWCDLDVKPGGCPTIDVAQAIVANLSIILDTRPSATVDSGHGLHAYWPISDGHIVGGDITAARALIRRFGRLVAVVADTLGAGRDSVYDLARMLRVPGTFNNKSLDGEGPLPVTARPDIGGPLTVAEVDERLTEIGICEHDDDRDSEREEVSPPAGWAWGGTTCSYVATMIEGWATDTPGGSGRNPWLCSQEVRLACAHRSGCVTEADYRRGRDILQHRHRQLLDTTEPRRKPKRFEFADAHKLGLRRAAEKTDEQVSAELGGQHSHGSVPADGADHGGPDDIDSPVGRLDVEHLEGDFWERESLKIIFDGALTRMCSPWAVLAFCVARVLAQVRPQVVLPPVICAPGSLNWFAIITAVSSGGKDGASAVAEELVPNSWVRSVKPGSGEGAVQAYIIRGKNGAVENYREAIMFEASEVDTLTALGARTGSNLMPVLREGFSGGALGFGYSDPHKATYLAKQTYRMTFVLSVQPARAGAIFAGEGGGTPQRFMWFPARDARGTRRAAEDRGGYVGKLVLPDLRETADWQQYPRTLKIPDEARDVILDEREKNNRGELDALDGHAVFCREKFAYALSILDGRTEMNSKDWELSGIAMKVSDHTRAWVAAQLKKAGHDLAVEDGELRGVMAEAADNQKLIEADRRVHRVLRRVLAILDGAPGRRMKFRDITRKISGLDYRAVRPALLLGDKLEQVRVLDDEVTWEKL
jgi:hypothetical protein